MASASQDRDQGCSNRQTGSVPSPAALASHRIAQRRLSMKRVKAGLACRQASDSSVAPQLTGSQEPLHACFEVEGSAAIGGSLGAVHCCRLVPRRRPSRGWGVDGRERCQEARAGDRGNDGTRLTARVTHTQTALDGLRVDGGQNAIDAAVEIFSSSPSSPSQGWLQIRYPKEPDQDQRMALLVAAVSSPPSSPWMMMVDVRGATLVPRQSCSCA